MSKATLQTQIRDFVFVFGKHCTETLLGAAVKCNATFVVRLTDRYHTKLCHCGLFSTIPSQSISKNIIVSGGRKNEEVLAVLAVAPCV